MFSSCPLLQNFVKTAKHKLTLPTLLIAATAVTSTLCGKATKLECPENSSGLSYLEQTSQAFSCIADQAIPATVFIKAEQKVDAYSKFGGNSPFDSFHEEFFRRFFGAPKGREDAIQLSRGSGFIITKDGHILTNNHVVKDGSKITVILHDGREYEASIIGTDPNTDLAIIKINEKDLPVLSLGDSDALRIGEWVVAIGSPFELQASLTKGVVSAKGRQDLGINSLEDYIQTDAAINPGNSGGPLLNLKGEVVGVNSLIVTQSGGYMGISFAIPSNLARHVVDQILASGTVQRAYLGVSPQPLNKELADELNIDPSEGVYITNVADDSPAAKAGLKQGDVIVEYEGKKIQNVNNFRNKLAMMQPGTTVNLTILRNNKRIKFSITLASWPEEEGLSQEVQQNLGMEVDNITPDLMSKLNLPANSKGVVITKIKIGSSAAAVGLKPGFIITGIVQGWEVKEIQSAADFNRIVKENRSKKHIILIVKHQNFQRYYTIKMN